MDRKWVANILDDCGTLLELKGENPFRCNAYHNASRAVQKLEGDLEEMVARGELQKVKGIGSTMAEKIAELVQTGTLTFYTKLQAEIPPGLVDMLRISGFGPKRIRQAYAELGIDSIDKLRLACQDGRLAELKGFGEKLAGKILDGIAFLEKTGSRVLYPVALALAASLRETLEGHPAVQRMEICGSLRRGRETIKDIDLLIASDDPEPIMAQFVSHPDVIQIVGHGTTKSSVLLANGVPADLRVVTAKQFPFALHYFTGSKEHNVAMRARAQDRGLKLNEYELAGPKKSIDCTEEADIFEALGLDYIPPELREDTGELEAAAEHKLPKLVKLDDITGCFHCHTNASDGSASLEEMAEAAKSLGLKYLGIADHSQTAAYAGGLKPDRIRKQHEKIDALNAKYSGFKLYKGVESDILADGSLDYDEETLASFDYVVASIHSPLNMDEKSMTERVVRAIRHPRCTMLGHPTG
ncbi:MAG: DNA polymerase/3'-5' exonuclease PolX [Planctomycetota bacterium]